MDRLLVKILIIVLICVLFINCEKSVDFSASTNGTVQMVKPTNTTLSKTYPNPIGNFLMELRNLVNTPNQINQPGNYKQIAGFPDLPPFIETLRAYFKMAYKSYILFQPEIKFGQCLTKYFYMRFPAAMRFFQLQNLSKYIRRMYSVSGRMMNNVVTRTIFTWFDDTELDRERIAIKMATITDGPMTPIQSAVKPILEFYETIQSQTRPIYPNLLQLPIIAGSMQLRRRRRFQRQVKYPNENYYNNSIGLDRNIMGNFQIQYKNNMRRVQRQSANTMQNIQPNDGSGAKKSSGPVGMDPDATIDLTNKGIEREAEELFNIDTMFWRSLGFEDSSFKRYSLAYCTRAYVTDSFSRFMKNIILS